MNIAINGFGRIGRTVLKVALENNLNVIAVNSTSDSKIKAYTLQYDSIYGKYNRNVTYGKDYIKVNNKKIKALIERDPSKLPWKKLKIDFVVESTGIFTDKEQVKKHLQAGAKKVLISAPSHDPDITLVPGVNNEMLKKEHKIISVASCTTNCLAPMVKVLDDKFGIKKGFATTVHAYTSSQNLLDDSHEKLRRARAAALNIIPTSSGAAAAVIQAIPKMKNRLDTIAIRVPVGCGSITDLVCELKKTVTVKQVNNAFKLASKGKMKNIIEYSEEELVSSDIIGNSHSVIIDGLCTRANKNMIKVFGWYDNEYGYSYRMIDALKLISKFR